MNKPTCPYMVSDICYRTGCIYKPHMNCMSIHEFRNRLKYVKKGKKKYEHQRSKNK